MATDHTNQTNELGHLLRSSRAARGKSQLDLSLEAGISQRHLSFIESGRSAPSRQKLLEIAEALDIPLRERNALLLAAGYAPVFLEYAWNDLQMKSINVAVKRMLKQQEPFPAVLMDRYWNVLATNTSAPGFFGLFIDMAARPHPRNILHLMFDPAGMRPFIRDWDRVAMSLLARVRREAVGHLADKRTQELIGALLAYPDATISQPHVLSSDELPVIPLSFEKDGTILNYFSMVSSVGTPTTITSQELRIECMFPADETTEARHRLLAKHWRQEERNQHTTSA